MYVCTNTVHEYGTVGRWLYVRNTPSAASVCRDIMMEQRTHEAHIRATMKAELRAEFSSLLATQIEPATPQPALAPAALAALQVIEC